MAIQIVILAAGKGKRMHSALPKVLHLLADKTLLQHVIDTAQMIEPHRKPIIIYGHEGDQLRAALPNADVIWVEQKEQLGTGHAVLQALSKVSSQDNVLILYGDVPLISVQTLKNLIETTDGKSMGMLTAHLQYPKGYGRIKRDEQNKIIAIIEEKDATAKERAINEINPGIYFVSAHNLKKWLPKLKNKNAQQEYYLTDILQHAVKDEISIHAVTPLVTEEILGINDRQQLAHLERFYQQQHAEKLMRQGVTLYDPKRLDIRGNVHVGRDITIDVNVILEGEVSIGDECQIGANVILRNVTLGKKVIVKPNSIVEGAKIASGCEIGPFARIRPNTVLNQNVHVGNFVELKKTNVDAHSKINHLSYVGDTEVGKYVNIGAGTITCNYDGVNKHKTIIGDNVFIGSNSQLIAPVTIGEGATIGAGSTITDNAPPHQLTLSRSRQLTLPEWERPNKDK